MAHTCQAVVVHCMDYRIQETIGKLLSSLGIPLGGFDRIAVAGGAGNFEQLEEGLATSSRLHHPQVVVLTVHEDCGAGKTLKDLKEALQFVRTAETTKDIHAFWVKLDETWEEVL